MPRRLKQDYQGLHQATKQSEHYLWEVTMDRNPSTFERIVRNLLGGTGRFMNELSIRLMQNIIPANRQPGTWLYVEMSNGEWASFWFEYMPGQIWGAPSTAPRGPEYFNRMKRFRNRIFSPDHDSNSMDYTEGRIENVPEEDMPVRFILSDIPNARWYNIYSYYTNLTRPALNALTMEVQNFSRQYAFNTGAYFPYILNDEFIFTENFIALMELLQIYSIDKLNNEGAGDLRHCLVESLELDDIGEGFGLMDERPDLNNLFKGGLNYRENKRFSVELFTRISEVCRINIRFDYYDSKGVQKHRRRKEFEVNQNLRWRHIAIYKGHYFQVFPIDIEDFADNFSEEEMAEMKIKKVDDTLQLVAYLTDKYECGETDIFVNRNLKEEIVFKQKSFFTGEYTEEYAEKVDLVEDDYRPLLAFGDTETYTDSEGKIKPYAIAYYVGEIFRFFLHPDSEILVRMFITQAMTDGIEVMFFHNLKFDFGALINAWQFTQNLSLIMKDGALYQVSLFNPLDDENRWISFRDSYKLIPDSIANFPRMFGLELVEKLGFNYELFTEENVTTPYFLENHKDYIEEYIRTDCKILQMGVNKMYENLFEIGLRLNIPFNLSMLLKKLSISSVADFFLTQTNAYSTICKIAGAEREFISKCSWGGRCMTAFNKRWKIEEPIALLDAAGLYSTAQIHFGKIGLPAGPPIKLDPKNAAYIWTYRYFFAKIKVLDFAKKGAFPLLCNNAEGINNWEILAAEENEEGLLSSQGIYYVDSIRLREACDYHGLKIEFLEVIAFKESRAEGYLLSNAIQELWKYRNELRAQKNPLQNVVKLIMNSCYGKHGLGSTQSRYELVARRLFHNYWLNKNNDTIISMVDSGPNYILVEHLEEKLQFNRHHVFSFIQSYAVVIIQRIFRICDMISPQEPIAFCTDTDSCHVLREHLPQLYSLYKNIYNLECIGGAPFQFKDELDEDAHPYAINNYESFYLGKKMYCINYERLGPPLDNWIEDYKKVPKHKQKSFLKKWWYLALKGISIDSLVRTCEIMNCTPPAIYQRLYDGEEITFYLVGKEEGIDTSFDYGFKVKYSNKLFSKRVTKLARRVKATSSTDAIRESDNLYI